MDRDKKTDAYQAAGITAAFTVAVWLFAPDLVGAAIHAVATAWVAILHRTADFLGVTLMWLLALGPVVALAVHGIYTLNRDANEDEQ